MAKTRQALRTLWKARRRAAWRDRFSVSVGLAPDACVCGHGSSTHQKGGPANPGKRAGRRGYANGACTAEDCTCYRYRNAKVAGRLQARCGGGWWRWSVRQGVVTRLLGRRA